MSSAPSYMCSRPRHVSSVAKQSKRTRIKPRATNRRRTHTYRHHLHVVVRLRVEWRPIAIYGWFMRSRKGVVVQRRYARAWKRAIKPRSEWNLDTRVVEACPSIRGVLCAICSCVRHDDFGPRPKTMGVDGHCEAVLSHPCTHAPVARGLTTVVVANDPAAAAQRVAINVYSRADCVEEPAHTSLATCPSRSHVENFEALASCRVFRTNIWAVHKEPIVPSSIRPLRPLVAQPRCAVSLAAVVQGNRADCGTRWLLNQVGTTVTIVP